MPYYISPPPSGPVARLVGAIIAVLAMAGAFMIGLAAFLVIAGVVLVLGVVAWFRLAWLRRKMRQQGEMGGTMGGTPADDPSNAIEAEFTVVSRDRD